MFANKVLAYKTDFITLSCIHNLLCTTSPHSHSHSLTYLHTHTYPTHTQLKRQFSDFIFPKLPGKRPFGLNDTQIDTRRRGLEDYLDKVCSAKVIFESDLLQDFLELKKPSGVGASKETKKPSAEVAERKIDMRVTLSDRSMTTVSITEHMRTPEVFEVRKD